MPRKKTKRFSANKLSSLAKDVRELKKESAANKGIIDTYNSQNVSTTTSWIHTCFQCAQGTELDDREGNSIVAHSVNFRGIIARGDTDQNIVRLLCIQFESYADATIGEALQYVSPATLLPRQALYSPYKVNGDCKYKVLFDKTYSLPNIISEKVINETVRIPKSSNIMKYTMGATQVPQSNTVLWYAVSDSQLVVHPQIDFHCRERFSK